MSEVFIYEVPLWSFMCNTNKSNFLLPSKGQGISSVSSSAENEPWKIVCHPKRNRKLSNQNAFLDRSATKEIKLHENHEWKMKKKLKFMISKKLINYKINRDKSVWFISVWIQVFVTLTMS